MRYRKEIDVPRPAAEVFGYVADFSRTSEWDPGVVESRRLSPAPTALDSSFEVIALFRGKRHRFEYVVTAYEEGHRITLHGDGAKAASDDTITPIGLWAYAQSEGGVLGPLDLLWQVYGGLVPFEFAVAAVLAWIGAR